MACHRMPTLRWTGRFGRDERGAMTLWLTVWSLAFLAFSGLAIDVSNMYRTRAMLQATSDSAAHAALVVMANGGSTVAARQAAQDVARANLPREIYGDVVDLVDVEIGAWTGAAIDASGTPGAVRVVASREAAQGNAVPTTMLTVIGIFDLDVGVETVAMLDYPPCVNDGIFARGRLKFTAQNQFGGNLCLHSQSELKISGFSKKALDPIGDGTVFSAPDSAEIGQGGNFNTSSPARAAMEAGDHIAEIDYNPEAASEARVRARIAALLDLIDDKERIIAESDGVAGDADVAVASGKKSNNGKKSKKSDSSDAADVAGAPVVLQRGFKKVTDPGKDYSIQTDIADGYGYFHLDCPDGGSYTLDGEVDLAGVVIVSTCALTTKGNDSLYLGDTVIAVDAVSYEDRVDPDTGASSTKRGWVMDFKGKSINAATAAGCGGFGEVTLLSTGSVKFTADTNFSHVEMVVTGEIKMTSKADLTAGVSMQSYDEIDFSAKANVQGCNEVANDQTEFRPVMRIAG